MIGQLSEIGSFNSQGPFDSLYAQGTYHSSCHILLSLILC